MQETTATTASAVQPAPIPAKKSGDTGLGVGGSIFVTAFTAIACWGMYAMCHPSPAPDDPNGTAWGAFDVSHRFVEKRLLSPGSAQWADYSKDAVYFDRSMSRWKVTSWVDSQNSFGALMRTHYTCTLHHTGGGNWKLDHLETQ